MSAVVSWKKALLVALVVLLVLIGVPVLMHGMGAAACHECGPVIAAGAGCALLAVLAGFALVVALFATRLRPRRDVVADLLLAFVFDRPPRLA